jgi:outer membrane protein assembly factor BamB
LSHVSILQQLALRRAELCGEVPTRSETAIEPNLPFAAVNRCAEGDDAMVITFKRSLHLFWIGSAMLGICASSAAADHTNPGDGGVRTGESQSTARTGVIVRIGVDPATFDETINKSRGGITHFLDTDPARVAQLRAVIRKRSGYGPISANVLRGQRLPYVDNLVNELIVNQPCGVLRQEMLRVLAPGGLLSVRNSDRLETIRKPRPAEMDDWTHFMYDASGNAVAHDQLVGPPGHLQWIADPRYARSHEYIPSIFSVVSSQGRIYYIHDKASVADVRKPSEWVLVARDAFNGVRLWERSLESWYPHLINWGHTPSKLQRKLVAVDDRVYVTLGLHSPLMALDAVSGDTIQVFPDTQGTEEVLYHDGVLLLVRREVTDERVQELLDWSEMIQSGDSRLATRESAEPLIRRLRATENRVAPVVLALDATSGQQLWRIQPPGKAHLRSNSLCATGRRVFFQQGGRMHCANLHTGEILWAEKSEPLRLATEKYLVAAGKNSVVLRDVEDGHVIWNQSPSMTQIHDVFVVDQSVWIGGFKPIEGKRGPSWGPYFVSRRDLSSGELLAHLQPENPGHHHRCYLNKATDRFILGGRRGTEFIDLASGETLWNSWVRGVCRYGVMPCNGLLYAPPHACACYMAAKTTGFYALSARDDRNAEPAQDPKVDQVVRGPAFGAISLPTTMREETGWPTYRGDASRSGYTPQAISLPLRRSWIAESNAPLSSPTVGHGVVVTTCADAHSITARSLDSGEKMWGFTAGGRIDSPPTMHAGRAIFGCRDGSIYSVNLADGRLDWVRLPVGGQRLIAVRGQLESTAPISGSVLIRSGVGYAISGHSSFLDNGIQLERFDPDNGTLLSRTTMYSPDPETGQQPPQYGPNAMPGERMDLLSSDDAHIYLRDSVFSSDGQTQTEGRPHLLTLTGFLDDSWTHRSFWIYGKKISISSGCSGRDRNVIAGRLLVFNDSRVFGYGRRQVHWSSQLEDAPYQLFARDKSAKQPAWEQEVSLAVRAMVLAADTLFVAGRETTPGDGAAFAEEGDCHLVALAADTGRELARYPLVSPPVFDGMAVVKGRVLIALEDGQLVCLSSVDP